MRNLDSDVAILPKSNAVVYSTVDPRDATVDNSTFTELKYLETNRQGDYLLFGDKRVLPNGYDNNFPINYKSLLDQVYIGHGIKRSLINLLLSGGVGLYRNAKSGHDVVRDWQVFEQFPQIRDWLDSWNFDTEYLPEAATDMIYVENNTALFSRNKGARVGLPKKVARISLINAEESRLDYTDFNQAHEYIYQSDWTLNRQVSQEILQYPIFKSADPLAAPHTALFLKMPTFGSAAYGRPTDIGATELLKLLAILPQFHRANLTEKPIRWLIKINSDLYTAVQQSRKWQPTSPEFLEWKENFKSAIDTFLYAAKGDKVQTRFFSEFSYDGLTKTIIDKIIIENLEDNTKELSETGLSLWDSATIGYVSANSIHPQLANIHLKNHALSGSNLVEAYNMHIATATPMMRELLLYPVNLAIRLNWPELDVKLGFKDLLLEKSNTKNTGSDVIQ